MHCKRRRTVHRFWYLTFSFSIFFPPYHDIIIASRDVLALGIGIYTRTNTHMPIHDHTYTRTHAQTKTITGYPINVLKRIFYLHYVTYFDDSAVLCAQPRMCLTRLNWQRCAAIPGLQHHPQNRLGIGQRCSLRRPPRMHAPTLLTLQVRSFLDLTVFSL